MFEQLLLIACVAFMFYYAKWTVKAYYEEAKLKNDIREKIRSERIKDDFLKDYEVFFTEMHTK